MRLAGKQHPRLAESPFPSSHTPTNHNVNHIPTPQATPLQIKLLIRHNKSVSPPGECLWNDEHTPPKSTFLRLPFSLPLTPPTTTPTATPSQNYDSYCQYQPDFFIHTTAEQSGTFFIAHIVMKKSFIMCDVSNAVMTSLIIKQVNYMWLWSIHSCFQQYKNYKNRPRNSRVIVKNKVALFFQTQ